MRYRHPANQSLVVFWLVLFSLLFSNAVKDILDGNGETDKTVRLQAVKKTMYRAEGMKC